MEIDFKKNLNRMRENYSRRPLRFKTFPKPKWMKKSDGLYQLYRDRRVLFKYGRVYYAHIVQANTLLFKRSSRANCPAEIMFTTSPIAEESPLMLKTLANEVYSYKGMPPEDIPENFRDLVRIITDEMDRTCADISVDISGMDIVEHKTDINEKGSDHSKVIPVRMTTIMVFRKDIPEGVLQGSLYPILAAPDKCKSAIILPKQYFTGELLTWKGYFTA